MQLSTWLSGFQVRPASERLRVRSPVRANLLSTSFLIKKKKKKNVLFCWYFWCKTCN